MNHLPKLRFAWIFLVLLYACELPAIAKVTTVSEAIQLIAQWLKANPVRITSAKNVGPVEGVTWEINYYIFAYREKDGTSKWIFFDDILKPYKFRLIAFPSSSNQALAYFPNSKLLVKFDPALDYHTQIVDCFFRNEIDFERLRPCLSEAKVLEAEPGLYELRFDFDSVAMHSKWKAPMGTELSVSIIFDAMGKVIKSSRTDNDEFMNTTFEHLLLSNDQVLRQLPKLPSQSASLTEIDITSAMKREILTRPPTTRLWAWALASGCLLAAGLLFRLRFRKKVNA